MHCDCCQMKYDICEYNVLGSDFSFEVVGLVVGAVVVLVELAVVDMMKSRKLAGWRVCNSRILIGGEWNGAKNRGCASL